MVKLLVSNGVNLYARTVAGETALDIAEKAGNYRIINIIKSAAKKNSGIKMFICK